MEAKTSVKLTEFVQSIPQLTAWGHTDRIKFFGWYVHSQLGRDRFTHADIRACYDELHIDRPGNISSLLDGLQNKKPREVIHDGRGYYLERRVRDQLEAKYGQRSITIQVAKLLQDLPAKVPNLTERTFLDEALVCFKHGAFRAAIVMCWNLAYDHLCNYVWKQHLATFNTQLPKSYPKADVQAIAKREDFAELKEWQVLQVCKSAGIISGDVYKVLQEKLGRRNSAAHPSDVTFSQLQAEGYIDDLVTNVVLKLV